MTRKRSNQTRQVEVLPSVTPEQGIELIQRQIAKGRELVEQRMVDSDRYSAWSTVTRDALSKVFGSLSPNVSSVMDVGTGGIFLMGMGEAYYDQERKTNLASQLTIMEGLLEILQTEISLDGGMATPSLGPSLSAISPDFHKVFLVHGRDGGAENLVARYLERLNLEVIILHEKPNQGRTIIEKFTDYSDVGFAVVLLTPDDRGGLSDQPYDAQRLRARQNVILELGFFLGRLGRNRVCALHPPGTDLEIPSDYSGVLFVPIDETGGWRFILGRELKAANINVDLNKAA